MADQYSFSVNLLDESFKPEDTVNYGLAIIISESKLSFCTLDFKRNKFIGLHQCVRDELNPTEPKLNQLHSVHDFLDGVSTDIPWLKSAFKLVKVAYDGKKSTLIPAALFDPDEKEQYLTFNYAKNQDEIILADHLVPLDAWQIYTVPEPLMQSARLFFPRSELVHVSSLIIESVWINYKNHISTPHVFLHIREPLFDVMIFDGRKMIYFNTFVFANPDDVAYYLIFILEQLNFNPEKIPVVLLGNIDPGDELSELLLRYVRHIETGRRNDSFRYSYILNQLPHYPWFPLLNFFSCGL